MVAHVVHHHAALPPGRVEAELAEDVALRLAGEGALHKVGKVRIVLVPKAEVVGPAPVDVPVRAIRAHVVVHVGLDPVEERIDLFRLGGGRLVGREEADVEVVPAERVGERRVELLEYLLLAVFHEPAPVIAAHEFVREAVEADLAAVTRLDQVFEVLGDLLGVFVRVDPVRERGHRARNGVERGAGLPEREVVVVGEAVELLLRLVGEARVDAPEGRRQLRERLEDALVAEVVRHERHEVGLRMLETEPAEEPAEVGFLDRHVSRRRAERQARGKSCKHHRFHNGNLSGNDDGDRVRRPSCGWPRSTRRTARPPSRRARTARSRPRRSSP